MKIQPRAIEGFLKNIPSNIKIVLLYGADSGLIMERINAIKSSFMLNKIDHEVIQMFENTLKENSEKLIEEACSPSLFGEKYKIIIIREVKDSFNKIIKDYLNNPANDCLIILQGDDLGASSSLRKMAETSDVAASVPCYLDNEISLKQYIAERIKTEGFNIDANALQYLVDNLGNDRGVTKQEVEKLMLYKYAEKEINIFDVEDSVVSNGAIFFDKLLNNFFEEKKENAYKYLLIIMEENNPIVIIRVFINHLHKLYYAKSLLARGDSLDEVLRGINPPIFFANLESFKKQLTLWEIESILNMFAILLKADVLSKTYPNLGEVILKDIVLFYKINSNLLEV